MANFDGYAVDTYMGRFAGSFDVDFADGETYLRYGNKVMMVVVGTVGPATMGEDSLGDMKRTNRVNVEAVKFVAVEDQANVLAGLDVHQPALNGTTSETVITPEGFHINENGEILGSDEPEEDFEDTEPTPVARIKPPSDKHLSRFLSEVPS